MPLYRGRSIPEYCRVTTTADSRGSHEGWARKVGTARGETAIPLYERERGSIAAEPIVSHPSVPLYGGSHTPECRCIGVEERGVVNPSLDRRKPGTASVTVGYKPAKRTV